MSTAHRKRFYMAGAALMLLGGMVAAAPAARADTDASAAAPDQSQIEPVTIFARKRAEDIQSVPIPVTVLGAPELARQAMVNFSDWQYKFPAFSVYLTNPKQLNIGVRGIGNNGFNTDGIDGSVGIFVDGVYTGRQGMVSNDFNDIAQVELLRGPQGTLFGKNTTAGAVIINSQKPSFTPEASMEATGGNQGLYEVKANVSGPLIADKLAVRVSTFYSTTDGNYLSTYNGSYQNARQGEGVRLQLLGNLSDNLTMRVIASHATQSFNTLTPVTLSVYNPAALQARMAAAGYTLLVSNASDRLLDINSRQSATTHSNLLSAEENLDLGDRGTLTSISAYQKWMCHTYNDNDYTQLDALNDYGSCNTERQFSQEFRWASKKGEPIEAVAGGFLSRQQLEVDSRVRFGTQYNIWAANPSTTAFPNIGTQTWASGAYVGKLTGAAFASHATFHTNTEALFGNLTWHPDTARKWSVNLGLRQTWEDRNMSYNGWVAANPGGLSAAQLNVMSASGANAQLGQANDSITDSSLSGQAGVDYHVTPNLMVYADYARGHKSKGFNLLPENATNPDPGVASAIAHGASQDIKGEQADNFEVGVKSEWLEHRLLLNLTAFDTYVKNYQANEAIGVGNTATKFLANVGALRSEGVELEAEAFVFKGMHLKGFIGYDHAYYASFHNSVCPGESTALSCDLTGKQVAWAPTWNGDLSADYTTALTPEVSGYINADVNWRSKQNTTITLDPAANINAYALANLRVGALFMKDAIDLQFWVENLFDKAYYINLLGLTKSTGIVQGYPGNPRTFGATLRVHY